MPPESRRTTTEPETTGEQSAYPIEIEQLVKRYGSFEALKGISITVEPGEIYGFLGPNGAGKTTTIRTLMGMLIPHSGRARILGYDCQEDHVQVKQRTGYLPDKPEFYDYLRGSELLNFVGRMQGLPQSERQPRIEQLMHNFELTEASEEFAVNYSAGMKQKLALAAAQLHEPEVFLLDEPTASLDPGAARDVKEWIKQTADSNKTVFLSTHLMSMAEELCTRLSIIHQGQIVKTGQTDELIAQFSDADSLEDVFLEVTGEAYFRANEQPGAQSPAEK